MCLHIPKSDSHRHTAVNPINVYKVLERNDQSPFQNFKYKPNERVKARMRKNKRTDHNFVDQATFDPNEVSIGLHAFRSLQSAKGFYHPNNEKIVKMTIPKGAHYYIGDEDDIVSDTLDTSTLKPVRLKEYVV